MSALHVQLQSHNDYNNYRTVLCIGLTLAPKLLKRLNKDAHDSREKSTQGRNNLRITLSVSCFPFFTVSPSFRTSLSWIKKLPPGINLLSMIFW